MNKLFVKYEKWVHYEYGKEGLETKVLAIGGYE